MEDGEQQPPSAEVGVIGEGILILLLPVAHEEEDGDGVETSLEGIVTSTATEIQTGVHPQGVIHHLTEVGEVGNGRRQIHGQGAHRDAEDLVTSDNFCCVSNVWVKTSVHALSTVIR